MTVAWILLGTAGALVVMGVLMNWLWALFASMVAVFVLFMMGVHAILGWTGVGIIGVVIASAGGALWYREITDSSHAKEWYGKLTED